MAYLPAGPNVASVKRNEAGAIRAHLTGPMGSRPEVGSVIQPPLLRSDGGVWRLTPSDEV